MGFKVSTKVLVVPIFGNFDDIFGSFFGENRTNKQKNTNNVQDKYVECVIDFLEACLGGKKEIKINFEEDCKQCNGTGRKIKKMFEFVIIVTEQDILQNIKELF